MECEECAIRHRLIENLRKELEAREKELQDLRETIADAIGARLRGGGV